MLFSINTNDGLPIYRQIVRQIKHAVASGSLKPGDKMLSQRDLSSELVISHLTVKKAYEILEAQGIVATQRGRGTFVAENLPESLRDEGLDQLSGRINEVADSAKLLGVKRSDCLDMLKKAWREDRSS